MDELTILSNRCQKAVADNNLDGLSKYLPDLQRLMPARDFKENFMPKLLLQCTRDGRFECFDYILHRHTHFASFEARASYYQIFQRNRTDYIPAFLAQCRKYVSAEEYKNYTTLYMLENAVKTGRVEWIDRALKNGAYIDRPRYKGYGASKNHISFYVYYALNQKQYDSLVYLLKRGIKGSADGGDLVDFLASDDVVEPMRYINALLEYGHVDSAASMRQDILNSMRYGRMVAAQTMSDLNRTLDKWEKRAEYRKFPAVFKPGIRLDELAATYQRGLGYHMTSLHGLAAADRFDEVVDIALTNKEQIKPAHLLMKDSYGNSVLDILGARNRLAVLNRPELWRNDPQGYYEILAALPPVYRKQLDVPSMKDAFMQARLRKNSRPAKPVRRRYKP